MSSLKIRADNVVSRENGSLHIIESMFSAHCDLAADRLEVLARLHPVKKAAFDLLPPNCLIEVHVNRPGGGIKTIDYATIRKLAPTNVIGAVQGIGFDSGAEPLIRQMSDRSFRLVFNAMPPLAHPLGAQFDMDDFGAALIRLLRGEGRLGRSRRVLYRQERRPRRHPRHPRFHPRLPRSRALAAGPLPAKMGGPATAAPH